MSLRLAVSGEIVPTEPRQLDEGWFDRIGQLGVDAVVTHLSPAAVAASDRAIDSLRSRLLRRGLRIVQFAGVDVELLLPPATFRSREIQRIESCYELASRLGAEMLLTGSGSMGSGRYAPHQENFSNTARERLVENLRLVADVAGAANLPLALEGHAATTLSSPAAMREIAQAVGSPWVRANVDPVNFLADLPSLFGSGHAVRAMYAQLAPVAVPVVHVKDASARDQLVCNIVEAPPGEGDVDVAEILRLGARISGDATLVVEHLPANLVPGALARVRQLAEIAGLELAASPNRHPA